MLKLTVAEWRRARDLTVESVAKTLNIHPNTYRAWEKNTESIPIKKCYALAEVFGVPFEQVIFLPTDYTECSVEV